MHFLVRILIEIWLKFVPDDAIDNKKYSFVWGNGLVPNRQQAITWTNDDPLHWHTYALSGLNKAASYPYS